MEAEAFGIGFRVGSPLTIVPLTGTHVILIPWLPHTWRLLYARALAGVGRGSTGDM